MDKDDVLKRREQLSALADGELAGDEAAALLQAPSMVDADLQGRWQCYQLIGDVLRGGEQAAVSASPDFLSRLQARLVQEPLEVPARPAAAVAVAEPVQALVERAEPANDASFRWKMVAGCASLAAVAVLAWSVAGGAGPGTMPAQPQLAAVQPAPGPAVPQVVSIVQTLEPQPVTLPSGEAVTMIRDARLDELLAAHKQAGVSSALRMPAPSGFLRSATFTAPER